MTFRQQFPQTRMRRLRQSGWIRDLVQEHVFTAKDLILPIFVIEGEGQSQDVPELPGVTRYSVDLAVQQAKQAYELGIPCVLVLPCVELGTKSENGEEAYNPSGLLSRAVRAIKAACPDLGIMCDIALDLYTSHGHDGILVDGKVIDNDLTLEAIVRQTLMQAQLGVDVLAPSEMMDGRVAAMRNALETNGHKDTLIAVHSAKFASALYGPYRDAARTKSSLGRRDKRTYQQNPANGDEAIREVALDLYEGADLIIAKPGTFYLDVIYRIRQEFGVPITAFHVSGEYAMIKAAAANGWIEGDRVMLEAMLALKRAGASSVVTYAAVELAQMTSCYW